jgi:hypothetical protein
MQFVSRNKTKEKCQQSSTFQLQFGSAGSLRTVGMNCPAAMGTNTILDKGNEQMVAQPFGIPFLISIRYPRSQSEKGKRRLYIEKFLRACE